MRTRAILGVAFIWLASAALAQSGASPDQPAAAAKPDARNAATETCLAEAKSRGKSIGASDIFLRDVKDTDKESDGVVTVRADVDVVKTDSKGKSKTSKKTFKCKTRQGMVTGFSWG